MAERPLATDETVDDRRVGLQPHVVLKPVHEDTGDARPLVRLTCFLLDDRGERYEFIGRAQRQIRRAARPDLFDRALVQRLHLGEDLPARKAAHELVSFGQ